MSKKPSFSSSIVVVDLSSHPRNVPLGMKLAPANIGDGSHSFQKANQVEPTSLGRSSSKASLVAQRTPAIPEKQEDEEKEHEDSGASTVTIVVSWERVMQSNGASSSSLGPVQRAGTVRLGDRLVGINGTDVTAMSFRQIMIRLKELIHDRSHLSASAKDDGSVASAPRTRRTSAGTERLRSLSFAPLALSIGDAANPTTTSDSSSSYLPESFSAAFVSPWLSWITKPSGATAAALSDPSDLTYSTSFSSPHDQRLYTFTSSIQRVRLGSRPKQQGENTANSSFNEEAATDLTPTDEETEVSSTADKMEPVVEYEVACNLAIRYGGGVLLRIGGGPPEQHTWSVWKRYSEFKALHKRLRISHGWQLDAVNDGWGVQFPPRHVALSLCQRPTNPSFLQKRRTELNRYWRSLQVVHDLFDFGNPASHRYPREISAFLCVEQHLNRANGSAALRGRTMSSQSLDGASRRGRLDSSSYGQDDPVLANAHGGGRGLILSADSWPSGRLEEEIGDDASSSSLSFHSGIASRSGVGGGAGSSVSSGGRRKRKIPGGAKAAFQRHVF